MSGKRSKGAKTLGKDVVPTFGDVALPKSVSIMSPAGEKAIPLVINPSTDQIQAWEARWSTFGRGLTHRWRWNSKLRSLPGKRAGGFIALAEGDNCHGMMIVSWPFPAKSKTDASLVYVEYLEVGPQNRPDAAERRELLGVGSTLLGLALDPVNRRIGYEGIGLHSLKSAEDFYRKYGMREFGKENGLIFFELSRAGEKNETEHGTLADVDSP